jgi:SPP1 family phage portal protein
MNEIELIKKLIKDKLKCGYPGREYYYYKPPKQDEIREINTIKNDKVHTFIETPKVEIYTNYFKLLVDQKINYLLTKDVTTSKLPVEFDLNELLEYISLSASIDGEAWLSFYVNQEKHLEWVIIPDREIITIYDKYGKYLKGLIRFYSYEKLIHVEIWKNNSLRKLIFKEDEFKNLHLTSDSEEIPHYTETKIFKDNEKVTVGLNFKTIPFIPLFNNRCKESYINEIENLIYIYNKISSGLVDNIYMFQEAVMKLKGYNSQDLDAFVENLKKYKVVPIDSEGDFDYVKIDIPIEARKLLIDTLKENIFLIGKGVDPNQLSEGNITNVVIKSRYSNLDGKTNDFEKQLKIFYSKLVNFINIYYNSNVSKDITFNRTQLFNETEKIENVLKCMILVENGYLSKETLMKNNPWIDDVQQEIKLIENAGGKKINDKERKLY